MYLTNRTALTLLGLFLLGSLGQTVMADTVPFFGTRQESLPAPAVAGGCSTGLQLDINQTIGFSVGSSNLGSFQNFGSACLNFPFPVQIHDGDFTFLFQNGDTLSGTWSGQALRTITPQGRVLTQNDTYIVTGGTGRFFNATGGFTETGGGLSTGTSAVTNFSFRGTLTAPGLIETPEPATLALLSTGLFGLATCWRHRHAKNPAH